MASSHGKWPNSRAFRASGLSSASQPGRGTFQSEQPVQSTTTAESPPPPLGRLLSKITVGDIGNDTGTSDHGPVTIQQCQYVASYNWLDVKSSTILVPGKPPAWTPPVKSVKLKEDSGNCFHDPNAARYPNHPIDPAVEAILATEPDFPTSQVDIFACSHTMRSLLRFLLGENKAFRMLVQIIGDTMFLVRRENSPTEFIPDVKGYGHTFPGSYTTWARDVKYSASHQRIMRYDLGGLNCLVRFEADGYLKFLTKEEATESGTDDLKPSTNDLSDMLVSATLQSEEPVAVDPSKLSILHRGSVVPQGAIFDLKTRSIHKTKEDTLGTELPRLWLEQVPNFILARHKSGVFNDIEVSDVSPQVDDWELRQQDVIHRFVGLLRKIIASAKGESDGKLELLRLPDSNVLEVRQQAAGANTALSDRLFARWAERRSSENDAETGPSDSYLTSGA